MRDQNVNREIWPTTLAGRRAAELSASKADRREKVDHSGIRVEAATTRQYGEGSAPKHGWEKSQRAKPRAREGTEGARRFVERRSGDSGRFHDPG